MAIYKYDPISCLMTKVSIKDKKVKANDAAIDQFKKTKDLAKQIMRMYSGTSLGRKTDGNAIIACCQRIIDNMDYYIQNASKGWYD